MNIISNIRGKVKWPEFIIIYNNNIEFTLVGKLALKVSQTVVGFSGFCAETTNMSSENNKVVYH